MADDVDTEPDAALLANDLAHRQAAYEADYRLRQAVHEARLKVFQDSTDRARSSAEFCRNSAAAIGTVYTGLLSVTFAVKDGVPLPAAGTIPALFLALSLVLSATYVAYVTPGRPTEAPLPHSSLAVDQERRVNAFGTWVSALVGRRVTALQSSVLSLGGGVAFLPAPFVGWRGVPLWAAAAVTASVVTVGPFALARIRAGHSETNPANAGSEIAPRVSPVVEARRAEELLARGDLEGATRALSLVVASGHPKLAPRAAYDLGKVRGRMGDDEGERAAYEKAIDSGDPMVMPDAAHLLASCYERADEVDAAVRMYEVAMSTDDGAQRASAAYTLGLLLTRSGRYGEARDAYQRAIDVGHPAYTGKAASALGSMLAEHFGATGREAARVALRTAMASADALSSGLAEVLMADLLAEDGDIEGAITAYRTAIERRSETWESAAVKLGDLLRECGDAGGAREAYESAYESMSSTSGKAPYRAGLALGRLREEAEDNKGAIEAYLQARRAVDDAATVEAATSALSRLGWRGSEDADRAQFRGQELWALGDVAGARAAFEEAIEIRGSADRGPGKFIGDMLVEEGDLEGAREAYRQAVAGQTSSIAGLPLGRLLRREGDLEGARDAYRLALATRVWDIAPRAALGLGVVLEELGANRSEIVDAYQVARSATEQWVKTAAAEALSRLGEVMDEST